jgi:hypothetical protein
LTEAEWVAGRDFYAMLRYLHFLRCTRRARATDPKVRLFACHCCPAIRHLLRFEGSQQAYRLVEAFALGDAFEANLAAGVPPAEAGLDAAEAAWRAARGDPATSQARAVAWAAEAVFFALGGRPDRPRTSDWQAGTAGQVISAVLSALVCEAGPSGAAASDAEERRQLALLHELFGNPFRPVALDKSWLTSTVVGLARGVDADQAFDRLPILADALQDAGCEDGQLLEHCRGPGPHVRGCWVVDHVLGRE